MSNYDALLYLSFGGPESRDDVIPFLENVLRGKNVPRQRMLEVAEHYYHFDGVSPINRQNRDLIAALQQELQTNGPSLPIYWGNRNWHPMLSDTLRQMQEDGIQRALAFFTSAFSSYSGCRQYREDIQRSQQEIGAGAPEIDKLRAYFNHPGFIEASAARVQTAVENISAAEGDPVRILFTAHSIPHAMAANCQYERQLLETAGLVSAAVGHSDWKLVYQSRSGPPSQPWLEPDICDYIQQMHADGERCRIVIAPIGFISDHMEVLFDLDIEARQVCDELGVQMVRAETVGTHPRFVTMIRELIEERVDGQADRPALGTLGPSHDVCPADCCLSGRPTNLGQAGRPG
jgi:ferrochelatase